MPIHQQDLSLLKPNHMYFYQIYELQNAYQELFVVLQIQHVDILLNNLLMLLYHIFKLTYYLFNFIHNIQ
jgi:hypothetical protein